MVYLNNIRSLCINQFRSLTTKALSEEQMRGTQWLRFYVGD